jgi:plastocyanin
MATLPFRSGSVLCALLLASATLAAQGVVSGQVSILERKGKSTPDLANTVVYLETAPGARSPTKPTHALITMHAREFLPHITIITEGSTIQFQNQDPFQHNAFSNSTGGTFDYGLSDRGTTLQQVLKTPGVYAVFCNIHEQMSAVIVVLATPWYTQAGSDGAFTIPAVPAGAYTLHIWHERGGELLRKLNVPAAGLTGENVQLDARGFRLEAHKNKHGMDYEAQGDKY